MLDVTTRLAGSSSMMLAKSVLAYGALSMVLWVLVPKPEVLCAIAAAMLFVAVNGITVSDKLKKHLAYIAKSQPNFSAPIQKVYKVFIAIATPLSFLTGLLTVPVIMQMIAKFDGLQEFLPTATFLLILGNDFFNQQIIKQYSVNAGPRKTKHIVLPSIFLLAALGVFVTTIPAQFTNLGFVLLAVQGVVGLLYTRMRVNEPNGFNYFVNGKITKDAPRVAYLWTGSFLALAIAETILWLMV